MSNEEILSLRDFNFVVFESSMTSPNLLELGTTISLSLQSNLQGLKILD